jgi:PAS domain S-box-containing protein
MQEEKFVYVNPGFEKIMGYSIDELKKTSFHQWICEDDAEKIKENYLSRINSDKRPINIHSGRLRRGWRFAVH